MPTSIDQRNLRSFHHFVGQQLQDGGDTLTPSEVLALWEERLAAIESARRGLEDIDAGRTKSADEFVSDFRRRHGLTDEP